jgi:ABC-2 type transport system permease protein
VLRRLWALIQKEFIQVVRDRATLTLLLVAPFLQLALLSTAIHMDIKHIPMVVADQSRDAASRAYLSALVASDSFDIVAAAPGAAEVIRAIDAGQASIGVIIPPDFADRVARRDAQALLVLDGSNGFTTQSASAAASAISQQYAVSLLQRQVSPLVNAHVQILYNPDLKDLWFLIPGLVANSLQAQTLLLTSMAVVRERERGTIEALLVTPIRPVELMLAKTIPNLAIVACNIVTVLALSRLVFGVPFQGSLPLFLGLACIYAICGLGLGLVISTAAQSQTQAMQLTVLITFAAQFLAGFLFPPYALPLLLRALSYAIPLTYFVPIARGIFLKGIGLAELWGQLLALLVLLGVILFAAARLFRQRLD